MYANNANKTPAAMNIWVLYSETLVIHGTAPINPAKTAPRPSETNNAGNAQQSKVPTEVKRLNDGKIVCRHSGDVAFTVGLFNIL